MRALRFTHVSIHAVDMDASLRFYTEVLGMEHLPSPDFDVHVEWLRLGDQQLHLFRRDTDAPPYHHIGLDVDDFEAAYLMARERGLFDDAVGPPVRELNDGSVQLYLRDPAGNLVEIDWPDVTTLDRTVVTDIVRLADERPQSPDALRARLYVVR
jgi:lactoylglutathione lyase